MGDKIKALGFTNVAVDNADNKDYKDAKITFSNDNKTEAEKIIEVLKKDYKKVSERTSKDKEITVILGKKD